MKVSVIIPVYNTGNFIIKCLDSLVNNEMKDIEIIIVNDGATDNSDSIITSYINKHKDENIVYLKKENGGLSDARNYGVPYATGEYIAFLDSDDYVSRNLYQDLLPYMEQNYDMIKYKILRVDEDGDILSENYSPIFENKSGEEAFEILYKEDKMTEVAWGYLYRKEFFVQNNFKYAKGLYHEDFGLTPLVLLKAKKVASINIKGYNYMQTSNSITRGNPSTIYKRAMDLLLHYDNMIKQIEKYDISEKSKENIKIYYTNCILLEINNLTSKEDKDKYIKEIKNRRMTNNIKARNCKQLLKKIILKISIKWYLKLR